MMIGKKINVAVIFGGQSEEHEVSLMSAKTIIESLDEKKYQVFEILISKNGDWLMKNQDGDWSLDVMFNFGSQKLLLKKNLDGSCEELKIDVAFPVLHGSFGEDGRIQGVFDMLGIKYVGCHVTSSALAMDKDYCKQICLYNGIPVVSWLTVNKNQAWSADEILNQLTLPCFVKPANMGSSVGVSKIKDASELQAGIEEALKFDSKVLIEKGHNVRELECAIAGNSDDEKNMMISVVGEIIPAAEFYDLHDKYYDGKSQVEIPANISQQAQEKIQSLAKRVYKALGCRGLARVDFFMDKDSGEIYFNEINTMPGFTKFSMYPMLMKEIGWDISKLLDNLIGFAKSEH